MPLYAFVDENGNEHELFYNSSDVPSIGSTVEGDGKVLTRVASFILDTAGIERKTHKYPYVSRALSRNLEGVGSYDGQGRPIIKSQSHERDVAARHGMIKE